MTSEAEVSAMYLMLLALINTHPDPKRLLESFDLLTANLQLSSAQTRPQIPADVREAVERFRTQIRAVAKD